MAIMQGDLGEYALPDILQFIHSTRKQGQLLLEGAAAASAGVYFSAGEIVHAYCPPRIGVPAFHQLLGWETGRFAFLKNAAPAQRTIHDDLQNLLLDGLRRLDEYRAIAARLPPRGAVLHLAPTGEAKADIRLTRSEWSVLSHVNGRRTLDEVLLHTVGAIGFYRGKPCRKTSVWRFKRQKSGGNAGKISLLRRVHDATGYLSGEGDESF